MTKFRTGKKAYAFRGAAALITAAFLTLLFTACPNANGNKPTTPKYQVTFSVNGGGGHPYGNGRQEVYYFTCTG